MSASDREPRRRAPGGPRRRAPRGGASRSPRRVAGAAPEGTPLRHRVAEGTSPRPVRADPEVALSGVRRCVGSPARRPRRPKASLLTGALAAPARSAKRPTRGGHRRLRRPQSLASALAAPLTPRGARRASRAAPARPLPPLIPAAALTRPEGLRRHVVSSCPRSLAPRSLADSPALPARPKPLGQGVFARSRRVIRARPLRRAALSRRPPVARAPPPHLKRSARASRLRLVVGLAGCSSVFGASWPPPLSRWRPAARGAPARLRAWGPSPRASPSRRFRLLGPTLGDPLRPTSRPCSADESVAHAAAAGGHVLDTSMGFLVPPLSASPPRERGGSASIGVNAERQRSFRESLIGPMEPPGRRSVFMQTPCQLSDRRISGTSGRCGERIHLLN